MTFDPRTATPDEWRAEAARRAERRAGGLPLHDDGGGTFSKSDGTIHPRYAGTPRHSRAATSVKSPVKTVSENTPPGLSETRESVYADPSTRAVEAQVSRETIEPHRDRVETKRVTLPWDVLVRDNAKFTARVIVRGGKCVPILCLSSEYAEAKKSASELASMQLSAGRPFTKPVVMIVRVWEPDRSRKRDIVNYAKLVQDVLKGSAYVDDSLVDRATWLRLGVDERRPRVEITVEEIR